MIFDSNSYIFNIEIFKEKQIINFFFVETNNIHSKMYTCQK